MDKTIALLQKHNLWGANTLDAGYKRSEYVGKVAGYVGNGLIKVLMGQRRSGKTYLLRQVAKQLIDGGVKPENTLIINRELADFDFLKTYQDLDELVKAYRSAANLSGKLHLFIDEVALIDEWEKILNVYARAPDSYELFISGSSSRMLLGVHAALLHGRYVCLEVFPFSYAEYLGVTKQKKKRKSCLSYLNSGGLPELPLLPNAEAKRSYVAGVRDTILLRDIIQRHSVRDPNLLADIFVYLVNNAPSLISITGMLNYFKSLGRKTSYDAVATYISYLKDAFLVHRCDRYDVERKEPAGGNSKYYINDLSYRSYVYTGGDHSANVLLENAVYLALRRAGFEVYTGILGNKREVDFVAKKGDKVVYLQVTPVLSSASVIERECSPLEAIDDSFEKLVVSVDRAKMPLNGTLKHIQAWELPDYLEHLQTILSRRDSPDVIW